MLIIVNTKAAAREIYKQLREKDGGKVFHLSTNLCAAHRRDILSEIREALDARDPVICVTTQLIEAGVDISFGCVVRSMAGLDNIAQAAGGCNRNGEYSELRPVYLMNLGEEQLEGSLTEIAGKQRITFELLDSAEHDGDEVRPDMGAYFVKLYRGRERALSFPCGQDDTLLDLLALNKERCRAGALKVPQPHAQAFWTAGKLFEVIDSDTQSILVPYKK